MTTPIPPRRLAIIMRPNFAKALELAEFVENKRQRRALYQRAA